MKIETKISGWAITDYDLSKFKSPFTEYPFINLHECMVLNQKAMNFILDTLRFYKGDDNSWVAWIDSDTLAKIAIFNDYPEYEKQLTEYFGENWYQYYLRFNH